MAENESTLLEPKTTRSANPAILEAYNKRVFGKITNAQLDEVVLNNTDALTAKELTEAVAAEKANLRHKTIR